MGVFECTGFKFMNKGTTGVDMEMLSEQSRVSLMGILPTRFLYDLVSDR